MDNKQFDDIKFHLKQFAEKKGSLTDNDIEQLLPLDVSVYEMNDLICFLEDSNIEIIHDSRNLNSSRNSERNIADDTNKTEVLLLDNDTVKQTATQIKQIDDSINRKKGQLKYIAYNKPSDSEKLKDISLSIFLQEEKIRGLQEKLINDTIPLLKSLVDKHSTDNSISLSNVDLLQEGYLRLLVAVREFRYDGVQSFADFALSAIMRGINEATESDRTHEIIHEYVKDNMLSGTDPTFQYDKINFNDIEVFKGKKKLKHSTIIFKDTPELTNRDNNAIPNSSSSITDTPREIIPLDKNNTLIPPLILPTLGKVKPIVIQKESLLLSRTKRTKTNYHQSGSDFSEQLFIRRMSVTAGSDGEHSPNSGIPKLYSKLGIDNDRRLSLYAKQVGDRGEEIVIKYLYETLLENEIRTIKWISKRGQTPGWDIEYLNSNNDLVAIEVKGTSGNSFSNVEITGNEWDAANKLQDNYWIYLVTGCFGINPQIQQLNNPVRLKEFGVLAVTPLLWKIEMLAQ